MISQSNGATRVLGIGAAVLGILAAFAGSPYSSQRARIDVDALARAVRHEDDHVTAIELAGWIKGRRDRLRIVDVRSAAEYEEFHIPTAERIAIDSLASARFAPGETIVLYSEGGPHAAQAWVFLRALGYDRVFFLRGGIYEWLEQVMNPTLGANASRDDSVAFTNVSAISRYFGGTPHTGVTGEVDDAISPPVARTDSAASRGDLRARNARAVAKIRRRSC
jgi:rhodanese-related sulfurtransferase